MRMNGIGFGLSATSLSVISALIATLAPSVHARSPVTVMTPNLLESTPGNSDWYMGWQSAFSVQVFVAASQLSALTPGTGITGMSFRCSPNTATFPSLNVNLPRFDVTLSPSVFSTTTISTTFANNIGPGAVKVRSGSLLVPANSFPASGAVGVPSPNAWYVPFSSIYVYPGGDLCVTIRGEGVLSNSGLFDGYDFAPLPIGSALYNYGDSNATNGFVYGPLGIRFSFAGSTNCPGDLNFDFQVDDSDFIIFIAAYNILDCADPAMPAGCSSDLNHDGVVDDQDFVEFVVRYNRLLCDETL